MCKSAVRMWKSSDRADRPDRASSLRNISHVPYFACPRAHFRRRGIFARRPPPRIPRLPFWQCANRRFGGGKALIERIDRIGLRVFETLATCHTLPLHELMSADVEYLPGGRLLESRDCHFGNVQMGGSGVEKLRSSGSTGSGFESSKH